MSYPKDLAFVNRREWAMKRSLMEARINKGVSRRNGLPKRSSLFKQARSEEREWAMNMGLMEAMITKAVNRRNGLLKRPSPFKQAGDGKWGCPKDLALHKNFMKDESGSQVGRREGGCT
eukprot:6291834-Karenia_brevis.AAC.1